MPHSRLRSWSKQTWSLTAPAAFFWLLIFVQSFDCFIPPYWYLNMPHDGSLVRVFFPVSDGWGVGLSHGATNIMLKQAVNFNSSCFSPAFFPGREYFYRVLFLPGPRPPVHSHAGSCSWPCAAGGDTLGHVYYTCHTGNRPLCVRPLTGLMFGSYYTGPLRRLRLDERLLLTFTCWPTLPNLTL